MAFFMLLLKDKLVADLLFKTILNTVIITTPCIALLDKVVCTFCENYGNPPDKVFHNKISISSYDEIFDIKIYILKSE